METTTTNTDYINWLHKLTIVGYDQGIMFESVHKDVIDLFYHQRIPISEAIEQYKEFLCRWNAIRKDQGYEYNADALKYCKHE